MNSDSQTLTDSLQDSLERNTQGQESQDNRKSSCEFYSIQFITPREVKNEAQ